MATTSMNLGAHWDAFITEQVESGEYASRTEVMREALRTLKDRRAQHVALVRDLEAGVASPDAGPLDMQTIKARARKAWDGARSTAAE